MACQSYFDELLKYIFTYSQIVIGNLPAMFYLALVASNNGTPTINKYNDEIPANDQPLGDWNSRSDSLRTA
jgi:hypothetical protein